MIVDHQPDGRILVDREALTALTGRPAETIRRRVQPVAVTITQRRPLYDAHNAEHALAHIPVRPIARRAAFAN